jgi:N-dimethylarginine dimethylaminohydrolase
MTPPTVTIDVGSEYGRLRSVLMCRANPYPARRNLRGDLTGLDLPAVHQLLRWRHDRYDVDRVHRQQDAFIDLLRTRGVEVLLAENRTGIVSQHYTRDIGFAVDDVFVVARPRRDFRQRELAGIRALTTRMSRVAYLDMGTIEGGDVMLHDDLVLVGRGEETSADGVDALRWALTRHGIDREIVTLEFAHRGVIHLDDELNIIAPGLALAHLDSFTPPSRAWIESHLDVVEVTDRELRELRVNALAIAPGTVVVEQGSRRIADILATRGMDVLPLDYSEINKLPGSFRCTTCPLRRDPE